MINISGLANQSQYEWANSTNRLVMSYVAKAALRQRMGRAGRTSPGICYRYSSLLSYYSLSLLCLLLLPLSSRSFHFPLNRRWMDPTYGFARVEQLLDFPNGLSLSFSSSLLVFHALLQDPQPYVAFVDLR